MTNIVVLIKQVPDTWSERKLSDGDYTLDRDAADAVLDEINEPPVDKVIVLTIGFMLPLPAVKLNSPTMLPTPETEFGFENEAPATPNVVW